MPEVANALFISWVPELDGCLEEGACLGAVGIHGSQDMYRRLKCIRFCALLRPSSPCVLSLLVLHPLYPTQ